MMLYQTVLLYCLSRDRPKNDVPPPKIAAQKKQLINILRDESIFINLL